MLINISESKLTIWFILHRLNEIISLGLFSHEINIYNDDLIRKGNVILN